MLKNYLTIAWRILPRQRVFSLINILGLATGMAACLLVVLKRIFATPKKPALIFFQSKIL